MENEDSRFLIQVRQLSKAYMQSGERITVLDRVDFAIERGAFLSIMGPSGSGKTTLFNLLGGLDVPDSGQILFEGKDIFALGKRQRANWRARNIGLIFQAYNLIPLLNAFRNVELPLLLTGVSRKQRKEKVNTALDIVGLADRARHYPHQLSGGQQQRVAIARAIVAGPSIILADEPTGNLDERNSEDIVKILRQFSKDYGKTVLLVTHDPAVSSYADATYEMKHGGLSAKAEPCAR